MNDAEKKLLLTASILNGKDVKEKQLQISLIRQMIKMFQDNIDIGKEEFELLVEDAVGSHAVSVRKAKNLLEGTDIFLTDEKGFWHINDNLVIDQLNIGFQDIRDLFISGPGEKVSSQITYEDNVKQAIIKGIEWMLNMVLAASDDGHIEGMPAFFSCDGSEDHIIGFKVAGTATSDALSLICTAPEYLKECGKSPDEIGKCIRFLLEKILKCQCNEEGWDFGGFYPYEDQPESYHPTVDATCLAVMALGTFYQEQKNLKKEFGFSFEELITQVENAVINGLEFLFRMELKEGCFGIYRYQGDFPKTAPNENCTRMVQSTMGVSKGSGIFDSNNREIYYGKCSQVIQKTYTYLIRHRAETEEQSYLWAPYFGSRTADYPVQDIAVSSARVCRSFIPVWWQMEEERSNILQANEALLCYWKKHEIPIANTVGSYRFNSPSGDAFSSGEYYWPSRPDMLTVFTVLQAYNLFGLALCKEDWGMIERAIKHTLAFQHPHGHWDNPNAEKTPFCAVTLAAVEALIEYRKARKV